MKWERNDLSSLLFLSTNVAWKSCFCRKDGMRKGLMQYGMILKVVFHDIL